MATIRRKLLALAVMAAFVFSAAAPMAAGAERRQCFSQSHHCRNMGPVVSCSCGHQHDRSLPATTDTRVRPMPASSTASPGPSVLAVIPAILCVAVQTAPLRGSPPDLPTLYATLLI